MKFYALIISLILFLLPPALAQGLGGAMQEMSTTSMPTNAPVEPTKVWVPLTLADGLVTKVASIYTQQFTSSWSELRKPSAGAIGLGTLTGSVGVVKATGVNAAAGRGRAKGGMEGWIVMVMVGVLGVVVGGAVL